ncbi:MAG: FAD-dependent oxidoreductase, partial [Planctomycetota bacterium]
IVFNEANYPHFTELLREIGVASRPTSMSFGVSIGEPDLEYRGEAKEGGRGIDWGGLFAQKRNLARPGFWRMVRDIVRFRKVAPCALAATDDSTTVAEFLAKHRFSSEFADFYLVPLGAALWSCPPGTFRRFPMRFVAEFLANHHMLALGERPVWRTIVGGSREYLGPLSAPFAQRIRTSTPVRQVRRTPEGMLVDTPHGTERFDRVVLACHADTALRILAEPLPEEREVLSAFPYQKNTAILHNDPSVLPRRREAWSSWNYAAASVSDERATVSYWMNSLQGIDDPTPYCVTLNEDDRIDPSKVLRRIDYDHPVYTASRQAAWAKREQFVDFHGVSYCGAYWGYCFHAEGVRSGLVVAAAIEAATEAGGAAV